MNFHMFVVVIGGLLSATCFADEPTNLKLESLKELCGGQWIINEDRRRLVETWKDDDNTLHSRSWMLDSCFKRIIRHDSYRYDAIRKKLVATIRWSNGLKWECDGEWDREMNALTWLAPFGTGTRSFTLRLVTPKIVEYKIVDRDRTGNVGWEYTEKRYLIAD